MTGHSGSGLGYCQRGAFDMRLPATAKPFAASVQIRYHAGARFVVGSLMKTKYKVAMAMFASAALGGLGVHALHAQAKPPVYLVVEIDVTNPDAYAKEFASKMQPLIKSHGGRQLAVGGSGGAGAATITPLYGEPPKRAAVQVWESMDKVRAYQNDPQYNEIWSIGQKYAKFRAYVLEGVPQ